MAAEDDKRALRAAVLTLAGGAALALASLALAAALSQPGEFPAAEPVPELREKAAGQAA